MPKVFTSKSQKTGEIGENIACKFLMKHEFSILERNYTKKWGEIDIVAEKKNRLYFIEVKSVSTPPHIFPFTTIETRKPRGLRKREKDTIDNYHPEDNMHPWKLKRLSRTIQTYLLSKRVPENKEWQIDLLVVYLDLENKKARVKVVSNIIL